MTTKLRIAFLGTGGISARHANEYKSNADAQIVAGCDVSVAQVHSLWKRVGLAEADYPPAFTDASQMYKATRPDAVVICTPHTLHFEHGMQALDAGCHVLMEKPMVTDSDHAYTLRDKVKAAGKVLVIGYNTPCTPEFFYLRQMVRDKALGQLLNFSGWLCQPWLRYVQGSWRVDPKLGGGGQAYDSGAHLMNSICWTIESNPAEVFAIIDNMGHQVDINSSINVRFENEVFGSVVINGRTENNAAGLNLLFEQGRVEIDGWGGSWINIFRGDQRVKYPPITGEPKTPAGNFVDAILGRDEPRTSVQNGIVQSELMDAVYESARIGGPARPKRRS